jgi:hypothetical protein
MEICAKFSKVRRSVPASHVLYVRVAEPKYVQDSLQRIRVHRRIA